MKVNWLKTIYFNFKKFDFETARKLPVVFYGPVKFLDISGEVIINAPVKMGMIGYGQPYEKNTKHRGIAEVAIEGKLIFNGYTQFGKDFFLYVGPNACLSFGNMSSMGSVGKIICTHKVTFGDYARLGSESQVIDTNFHPMIDVVTRKAEPMEGAVNLGSYNSAGNRVSIVKGTNTPDYCTISSSSLCNKDYTSLGQNIVIGGIPAKLLRTNITRDWENEKILLNHWLVVW